MPLDIAPPTPAVKPVDGKAKFAYQALSALDATDALSRAPDEAIQQMIRVCLEHGDAAVFLWGATGLALLTVLENPYDGRFAFISWLQNDADYTLKDVLPTIERWAENQGALRVAAAVERGTPQGWEKLTGYTAWKMVIAKVI